MAAVPTIAPLRVAAQSIAAVVPAVILLFTVAIRAHAQDVRGIVRDALSRTPVTAANIILLHADTPVDESISDAAGRFVARAGSSGAFQIRVSRIGYADLITRPFQLGPQESAELELHLRPEPSSLEPVEAVVERRLVRLERVGFYRRSSKGFGYFLTPEALEELRPLFVEDLFYGMGGIRVVRDSGGVKVVRWPWYKTCPLTVAVDGSIVPGWNELVHVNDILALEVYPRPAALPAWLAGNASPCGAVVIWTK